MGLLQKSGGVRSGRLDQIALIKNLRALKGQAGGRLPAMRVPLAAFRESRRSTRVVRRHGLAKAAKRLDMSRWELKANMHLRQNLRRIGPYRPMRCKAPSGLASALTRGLTGEGSTVGRVLSRNVVRSLQGAVSDLEIPRALKRSFDR